jgi:hypothetical protein
MMVCTPDEIIGSACGGSGLTDFALLSGVAIAASAAMLAALYLWASIFRNASLTTYVKSELYELFITGLLIVLIGGAAGAMSSLKVNDFLPYHLLPTDVDSATTIYQASALYFEKVGEDMSGWLSVNYILSMYVDQVASVTPYARPLGVGLVASPMAGFAAPIKQLLYQMSTALSIAFIINSAQKLVYIFALQAFLKYYLPLGFFFRAFTPTRRLGGALIGLSLTFLFVYPALTTITYSMFYNRSSGPLITFNNMITQYFTDTSANGFLGVFGAFYENNFTDVGSGVSNVVGSAFGGIGHIFQTLVGSILLTVMLFPISVVSYAFAIGFVVPAFNIMILSQVAKNLSKSFGEEVDISSLTRMV